MRLCVLQRLEKHFFCSSKNAAASHHHRGGLNGVAGNLLRTMSSSPTKNNNKTFLFWFSNEHANFRNAELNSLFRLLGLDGGVLERRVVNGPFVLLDFPSESEGPLQLMSRSVLAHSCYEVWSEGDSMEEVHSGVREKLHLFEPFTDSSFRIRVETFGKSIPHSHKVDVIKSLDYLPLKGKVSLDSASVSFHVLQYYGLDPNRVPDKPHHTYFGRWVSDGQRILRTRLNLRDRKFIGNTSMDPLLSLIMSNVGCVKPGDVVYDPFVGTGSLLVASAVMGGFVIGSDIDFLMVHGRTRSSRAFQKSRGEGESVRANLVQYGVEDKYLDILVSDASRRMWRDHFAFDAIITDPPYGIREPTSRVGSSRELPVDFRIEKEHLANHVPQKRDYSLRDIFCDLLDFAARHLTLGGRLVTWIPISRADYDEGKLPRNGCLQLVVNEEQVLTAAAARRLLAYTKVREFEEGLVSEMDGSALMYRLKFFESLDKQRREQRRAHSEAQFGKTYKKGHLSQLEQQQQQIT